MYLRNRGKDKYVWPVNILISKIDIINAKALREVHHMPMAPDRHSPTPNNPEGDIDQPISSNRSL